MNIVIFGGDGYIGWPLAIRLALTCPQGTITLVDNLARRRLVEHVGGNSITPIAAPHQRLRAFRDVFGQDNLEYVDLDVTHPDVAEVIATRRPEVIYHLAQQASAPYSMMGPEQAVYTVQNNEVGNMRILWAIKQHAPDAHLVKLGTFGEYAKCGVDIPEGYYYPVYKGKTATRPAPFPRETDDIYHVSKINDTNYISMACRKWGLRVTDVMQSTIYGVWTHETTSHPELYTRLDYDAVFGTVVNRFLAQAVSGQPMTVYGTGYQRTGLMALEDSLHSLAAMSTRPAQPGEHKVINHVTERDFCVLELAHAIRELAQSAGIRAEVQRGTHDPRDERETSKQAYEIETHYLDHHFQGTPMAEVLPRMFEIVARHRDRIDARNFPPVVRWC